MTLREVLERETAALERLAEMVTDRAERAAYANCARWARRILLEAYHAVRTPEAQTMTTLTTPDLELGYDLSIHSNPDAAAWARFFKETCDRLGKECDEAQNEALRAALVAAEAVARRAAASGHDGDEETGEHYPDCEACAGAAALAAIEATRGLTEGPPRRRGGPGRLTTETDR